MGFSRHICIVKPVGKTLVFNGEVRRKMNFTCVGFCGVEGRGKSLSAQFFFVCEKDDREESITKSLGGMTRPKDEMGSQIVVVVVVVVVIIIIKYMFYKDGQ